jgi:uncharacterized protein (DUF3820 family)
MPANDWEKLRRKEFGERKSRSGECFHATEERRALNSVRTMPFGKYKGRPFPSIPRDYLEWVCREFDKDCDLRREAEMQLAKWDSLSGKKGGKKKKRRESKPPEFVKCLSCQNDNGREIVLPGRPERARLCDKCFGELLWMYSPGYIPSENTKSDLPAPWDGESEFEIGPDENLTISHLTSL